jgi:O-antigen ligase
MWWSLVFVFIYGFIEILIVVFGIYQLIPVLSAFDIFPFVNTKLDPGGRVSSISYEVPALGNYLIMVAPWMFSYILTSKQTYMRFLPVSMVLILMFFSGSRTALINVTIQLLIFLILLLRRRKIRVKITKILTYTLPVLLILLIMNIGKISEIITQKADSLNFSKNLTQSVSNKTRFGMQYASLKVFIDHPVFGVGLGQETYHKRKYYPEWATKDNFEFDLFFENEDVKSFPSGYNIYTRLLAETGAVGFMIFIGLISLAIFDAFFYYRALRNSNRLIALTVFISLIGLSLNWLQTDFFRQYGFWLMLAILIKLKQQEN